MSFQEIKKATEAAVEAENMPAIKGLAMSNKFAVSEVMSDPGSYKLLAKRADAGDDSAPELFFLLRGTLNKYAYPIFARISRQVILRTSIGITSRGLKGTHLKRIDYEPGADQELDIEETLENYMDMTINSNLEYDQIVTYEKVEKSKSAVLIFDTSGSLYGKKFITAALTVAVLSHHLAHDEFAVVLFNTKAHIIKRIGEKIKTDDLVNRILSSDSAGYTNISEALYYGGLELEKSKNPNKFGIIVTDGAFNRGGDPRPYLKYFPKLHVMALPSEKAWGSRVCVDMARYGKGQRVRIENYKDIPRLLMRILRRT